MTLRGRVELSFRVRTVELCFEMGVSLAFVGLCPYSCPVFPLFWTPLLSPLLSFLCSGFLGWVSFLEFFGSLSYTVLYPLSQEDTVTHSIASEVLFCFGLMKFFLLYT
jgi:hypothetical protein